MTSPVDVGGNPFHLTVDGFPADRFHVESFVGREVISRPYAFDVVVTADTPSDEELERLALGQRAVFTWDVGKGERALYGVVAAVRLKRVHDAGTRTVQYHLRIVPRLWLRKRRRRTRIFQKMRVREIVDAVLTESGIGTRWQLLREYPVHTYCTQYEESDLHFVTRLCAESGIYFHFSQGPSLDATPAAGAVVPGDTVVFGDDASSYPPIGGDDAPASDAPALYFLAMQDTATSHLDKITHFSSRTVVKATAAAFRDHDPARPLARLESAGTSTHPFKVRLVVAQQPYKNEDFDVEGLTEPQSGTTDADGMATITVPVLAREMRLVLKRIGWAIPLGVGDMDPIQEASGLQKRLVQLAYLDEYVPGDDSDRLRMAVADFQRDNSLAVTGDADDATRAQLVQAHGS